MNYDQGGFAIKIKIDHNHAQTGTWPMGFSINVYCALLYHHHQVLRLTGYPFVSLGHVGIAAVFARTKLRGRCTLSLSSLWLH